MIITEFKGRFRFLSNFYPAAFTWRDICWPYSENAYQAAKQLGTGHYYDFSLLKPGQAKRLGRGLELRDDWDVIKFSIMEEIVYEKFKQNSDLHRMLMATGDLELQEGNTWGDLFWGISPPGSGNGANNLGRCLMHVREQLRYVPL